MLTSHTASSMKNCKTENCTTLLNIHLVFPSPAIGVCLRHMYENLCVFPKISVHEEVFRVRAKNEEERISWLNPFMLSRLVVFFGKQKKKKFDCHPLHMLEILLKIQQCATCNSTAFFNVHLFLKSRRSPIRHCFRPMFAMEKQFC